MAMTKKDFLAIAAAINTEREYHAEGAKRAGEAGRVNNAQYHDGAQGGIANAAAAIAGVMERSNPRFDRKRFMEACGLRP